VNAAARTEEDDPGAKADHRDDRDHFDDREPELALAVGLDIGQVQNGDQREEDRRGDPGGHARHPVVDVDADHGQLGHADCDVVEPVVPPGEEPSERPQFSNA